MTGMIGRFGFTYTPLDEFACSFDIYSFWLFSPFASWMILYYFCPEIACYVTVFMYI